MNVMNQVTFVIEIPVIVRILEGQPIAEKKLLVRVSASSPQEAVEKVSLELQRSVRREWGGM